MVFQIGRYFPEHPIYHDAPFWKLLSRELPRKSCVTDRANSGRYSGYGELRYPPGFDRESGRSVSDGSASTRIRLVLCLSDPPEWRALDQGPGHTALRSRNRWGNGDRASGPPLEIPETG